LPFGIDKHINRGEYGNTYASLSGRVDNENRMQKKIACNKLKRLASDFNMVKTGLWCLNVFR
jgi:hypothetical protein